MTSRTVTRTRRTAADNPFAAALKKTEVVSRKKVGEIGAFSIKQPKRLTSGKNPQSGETYDHFYHLVTGGGINFHVYGTPQRRGQKLRVTGVIYEKVVRTIATGEEKTFMYVDLFPTDAERLEFEMKTMQDADVVPAFKPKGSKLFKARDAGKGGLFFLPIDHEARQAAYDARMAAK